VSAVRSAEPRPPLGDMPVAVVPRTTNPVKFWALIGCLMWVFQICVLIKWLTGPYFHQVLPGPVDPPTSMKMAIVVFLVVEWTAFAFLAYRWLIKPVVREHRLSFDGMMFLCWCAWYWFWDPFGNYLSITYSYNSWIPNMGSWTNSIPGWNTPGTPAAQIPEPWLFTGGLYGSVIVGTSILGCALMRLLRRRFPAMGTLGLLGCTYAVFIVVATGLELLWMRIGFYTYLATPSGMPVAYPDHYYKYPLVEGLFFGAMLTSMVYLRWSINDRGESIAERGAADLRIASGPKAGIRLMAVVGFTNVIVFLVFYVPYLLIWSPHPEHVPLDIQQRSYFMNGLCGPETNIACPDENVPLFRERSVTITPDGKLHVPDGVTLPDGPTTFDDAARLHEEGHR
jgi:Spirocyclase AveC-like